MTTPDKSLDELREAVFRAFERCLLDGEDEDVCAPAVDALIARARQEGAEQARVHIEAARRLAVEFERRAGAYPSSDLRASEYRLVAHELRNVLPDPVEADHD